MRRAALALVTLMLACGGSPPPEPTPPPLATSAPSAALPEPKPDRSKLPEPGPAPGWALPSPARVELDNGVPVYFLEQGPTPLVTVLLLVSGGAVTDPVGKEGLTATTIDMLDEGAGGKDALALSEALQRLGTEYSATTDVEHAVLGIDLIAESFEPSVALLADIARRPTLDAKEFARRKQQRIAEAISAESEPTHGRAVVLRKALFGDGYGSYLPAGTRDSLTRVTLADVKKHYQAMVAPEGVALIVAGGIDQKSAVSALNTHFGSWSGAPSIKARSLSSAPVAPDIFVVDYPGSTQSAISLARRATGHDSDEYFPALVHNRAFGEAFTSRVNMNLREDKGYTYGARSVFTRWPAHGFFAIAASVKSETTRPSIDEVLKELEGTCGARPLSQEERNKAVGGLLLGYPGRFESVSNVARELMNLPLYQRPVSWFSTFPGRVQAVDLTTANQLGKRYCDGSQFAIVIAGDKKSVVPTLEGLGRPLHFYDARGKKLGK